MTQLFIKCPINCWIAAICFAACTPSNLTPLNEKNKADKAVSPTAAIPSASVTRKTPSPQTATPPKKEVGGKQGWTTFRGSPSRSGQSDVKGPRRSHLKWVFRTQGRIWADAAVSSDGQSIFVASHDKNLYAIDNKGRRKWAFGVSGKIWTSPTISKNGTIYIGHDNDELVAVSDKGSKLWGFTTTKDHGRNKPEAGRYDVDTAPALLMDGSIAFGCHNELLAIRPLSGKLRWVFPAGTGRVKVFSSPAVGPDGTLYFGTQGNYFFAINQSAKVLWNIKTGGDNDSTPAVDKDGVVYMGSDDGILRAIAPGGKIKWEHDLEFPIRAPISLGYNDTVYASTYGHQPFLVAINRADGSEKWRFHIQPGDGDFYGIQSGALIDAEGYIYFGGRDHFVYCLSAEGQLVWKYKTGGQVDAGAVMGPDGTLYIGSDDHRLYAFSR